MNTKQKGNRQERRCRDWLATYGYKSCKAGASLGTWDLISINADTVLLVQVKSNRWPRSKEMKEMEEFDAPWGAQKIIVRYDDKAKFPKIKHWLRATGIWQPLKYSELPEIGALALEYSLDDVLVEESS